MKLKSGKMRSEEKMDKTKILESVDFQTAYLSGYLADK